MDIWQHTRGRGEVMRGYFSIGIYQPKYSINIGTLWRSAHNFGASYIFTIGHRYERQSSDTTAAWRSIPLFQYEAFTDFKKNLPHDCLLIAVEQADNAVSLKHFDHPERASYILGAEDHGIPLEILNKCHRLVQIDTPMCLNVAVAGSIIMFHRTLK